MIKIIEELKHIFHKLINLNRTLDIKDQYQTKVHLELVNVCKQSSLHSNSTLEIHTSIFFKCKE